MNRRSVVKFLAMAAVATPAVIAPALVTSAAAQLDVRINFGPPPAPRYEPIPAPRYGYVWAPGAWIWSENRHVWRAGYWVPARAGYRYVPDRWESYWEGGRERWRHVSSRWDRDGDGIPNRYDRDRDGDGVPNKYDHNDHNPRRW